MGVSSGVGCALWGVLACALLSSSLVSGRSLFQDLEARMAKRRMASCPVHQNEAMLAVFDRICDLCHEMFHHEMPDLRTQCRADCFKNDQFKLCFSQYSPGAAGLAMPPPVRRSNYYVF